MNTSIKALRSIILSLFLALLAGAIFFAYERILFCDASLILTNILNTGALSIQEHRYGSFITQMFPLLAVRMHLPLQAIVVLYSAAFNLFYLSVACILLFRFKNYPLAVLMAFYFILFTSDTYFWTNNEIHQAIAWLFLLAGTIINYKSGKDKFWIHASSFSILSFLCLFTHPLIIIILPFLWLFILSEKNLNPYLKKEKLILSGLLVIFCLLKYYMMNRGGYDTDKVRATTHFSLKDVIESFASPMAKTISSKMIISYYFIPLLFATGIFFAYKAQKYKQVLLASLFTIGYFIAICLTFNKFVTFHSESEWMPFTIITTILFVYYALPKLKVNIALTLLIVIFTVRLAYIAGAAPKFIERKNWVFSMLDKMDQQGIHKGYIYKTEAIENLLIISWAVPTESLIASSLRGDKPTRTFVTDSTETIGKRKVARTEMIASFGSLNYDYLNPVYFSIDTIANYKLIETTNP